MHRITHARVEQSGDVDTAVCRWFADGVPSVIHTMLSHGCPQNTHPTTKRLILH